MERRAPKRAIVSRQTPASYALAKTGPAATPWLLEALKSDKARVRPQAAVTLGDIGLAARSAVPAREALAEPTPVDRSVLAAQGALSDIAPQGVKGWLWKAWYEIDVEDVLILLFLGLVTLGIVRVLV